MSDAYKPDWVSPPGDTLREWMEEEPNLPRATVLRFTALDDASLELLLDGDLVINDELAYGLAELTGVSQQFWRNRERLYREGLAEGKRRL